MPLLDHFHPPRASAVRIPQLLGHVYFLATELPPPEGYFAEANVQFGVEIDVAAFEEHAATPREGAWNASPPLASFPLDTASSSDRGRRLQPVRWSHVGRRGRARQSVQQDRPAHRDALVSKCAAYLQSGVGLVLVDVVTDRSGDLHRELLRG